ncbi:MAG TPA: DMT family transporter [Aliiroseovarius sp.]|nr:DMT family transporter [Aliiroseovarius sp.]
MSPTLKAAIWMIGAIVSFSAMAVAGRAVSVSLDTFELLLYRSLIGLFIVLAVGGLTRTLPDINARHLGLHFMRNISHFTGQNLWFFAITVIPLSQVFALEFTSPLWVALLAPLIVGERLTRNRALAAFLGFIGILIIARPTIASLSPGVVAAAFAAVGFALSALFTRRLTRDTSIICILFWLTLMQAVFGLICAGYDGDITLPDTTTAPWLAVIAVGGLVAHYCLTTALSLAPASVVIPIDFTRLPLIALIGALVYNEPLELAVVAGAALIIFANILNLRAESRSGDRSI